MGGAEWVAQRSSLHVKFQSRRARDDSVSPSSSPSFRAIIICIAVSSSTRRVRIALMR